MPLQHLSRRDLLRRSCLAAAGFSLLHHPLLHALAAPLPTKQGKASSVIQIWLNGGPSQIDTFDPKPDAGYDYCGLFTKPIETNIGGIRIGEMLPQLSKQADKYSLIRSMTHGSDAHETATYMTQTGRSPGGRLVYPCLGAAIGYAKGFEHGYQGQIPPYISLTEPLGRFDEAGFMGTRYKPFITGGNPAAEPFIVEGIVAAGLDRDRQLARRDLLASLNHFPKAHPNNAQLTAFTHSQDQAYEMIVGDGAKAFDLTEEKEAVRERYGRSIVIPGTTGATPPKGTLTKFGQSCLVARRLVERGVPFVTINFTGWDTHKNHFPEMKRLLPELDFGVAALLADLADRGLLETTIVMVLGEFGRTPQVMWEAPWNGGRGHWGKAFSALVAGGGFKGGQIVGATDDKGETVTQRPVYPCDLLSSVYTLLGIDLHTPLPNPNGLTIPIMPAPSKDIPQAGLLTEIM